MLGVIELMKLDELYDINGAIDRKRRQIMGNF